MTDDPKLIQESTPEVGCLESLHRDIGNTDNFTEQEINSISQRLGRLILDAETTLYPHQQEAFLDIVNFFKDGGRECYVKLPTGSGKTNILVEVSKRLIESHKDSETTSKVIVLEPNIDLVDQTVGSINEETGKRRGFKGFASELDVRGIHSKVSPKNRDKNLLEGEVLITTYNSFRNLISAFSLAETKSDSEWRLEKEEFVQTLQNIKLEHLKATRERDNFIKDIFETQEVERIFKDADKMLAFKQSYTGLTDSQYSVLESIVSTTKSDHPNNVKINIIKRLLRTYVSPETKDAIRNMESLSSRKRGRKKKGSENEDEVELIDQASAESMTLDLKALSDFDSFVTKFIWRNRYDKIEVQRLYLNSVNWKRIGQLNDKLLNLRSTKIHMKGRIEAINRLIILKKSLRQFDLIICDEAHRAIGSETWDAIREFSTQKEIALLGLTATDEYSDRTLSDFFEEKAHELTKQEAMRRQIINPLTFFVHETGLQFEGVGVDVDGDYDRVTIRQMRFSEERNKIGIDYAGMLSEAGYHGIMPAIPGDGGAHAKELAKLLNEKQIIDPKTGELRNIQARYVLNDTPRAIRQEYYAQLESGELDWLTFVDVIREGWDSDNAKAMVNMRPTRSPLLATQRLGRIGRTFEGAPISIVIDLYDGIISDENYTMIPPVLASDIFNLDDVVQGSIIGKYDGNQNDILEKLREKMKTRITSYHNRYLKMMQSALIISPNGIAMYNTENGKTLNNEWKTFSSLQASFQGFLPKEIILEAIDEDNPKVRVVNGRRRVGVEPLFNVHDVMMLHQDKPEINPWKLYIDENKEKWITPEGCTVMLTKKFPNLLPEEVSDAIRQIESNSGEIFEKRIGRVRLFFGTSNDRLLGFTHMFKLTDITKKLVPHLLSS